MLDEYHVYVTTPSGLSVSHIFIDEDTVDELLLLKDDVCRMNREHDARTYAEYDLDGATKVRVEDDGMEIGGYGYEGWEGVYGFDFDRSPWFDTRCIFNPSGDALRNHRPTTISELFEETLLDEHWDEFIEWADDRIHSENFSNDIAEYETFLDGCIAYVEQNR